MATKVTAYDRKGRKVRVPAKWFDIPEMAVGLSRTRPDVMPTIPAGKNSPTNPDDPDFPTAEQIAGAAAAAGALKGQALKDALKDAGLPQTGTADEQRAALADLGALDTELRDAGLSIDGTPDEKAELLEAHRAEQAAAADANPTDSTTGDNTDTPPAGEM